MKKILFFLSCGWIFLSLSGCSSPIEAETSAEKDSDNTLVVYSPNPEDLIEETIPAFEEKYGIKVDLVQASTGELFKKAEAEKESPVADVISEAPTPSSLLTKIFLNLIFLKRTTR